jgi:hypothetical protein
MRDLVIITLLVVLTAGTFGFARFLGVIVGRRS